MVKDIIDNNEEITTNSKQIEILKNNFPSCFSKDGAFDIEKFKTLLNDKIDITNEGYELNFLGKNYARLLASIDTTTLIKPDEEHNSKPENRNSENIYISGDNLDALKHLLKSYSGKIKCIYIDPPYNTGSDGFVYSDNFNFTIENLTEKLSIDEIQAERILNMTSKGSSSHSAWLMFMYPRLLLARDLILDDGVVFISIDENECYNLKLLCDDVFGEINFVCDLTWEKKKKGSFLSNSITNIKESVLVYSKNKNQFKGLIGEVNTQTETYPCVNASNKREIIMIPSGIESKYKEKDYFLKKDSIISNTTMNLVLHSDLVIKEGVLAKDVFIEGNWRYSQNSMLSYANKNELYITQDLYIRRIVKEPRNKGLKDLLLRTGIIQNNKYTYSFDYNNLQSSGWGTNENADEEQRLIFGEQSLMNYPKPVLLIMKLLISMREEKMIVCDFFSGSATTAEAIMRCNLVGKEFNYILVQLPENLDYKLLNSVGDDKKNINKLIKYLDKNNRLHTLDQLGLERIQRVRNIIKEKYPETTVDLGFKHYILKEPSNNTLDKLESFNQEDYMLVGDKTILDEFGSATVIRTWLERDGYGLTVEPIKLSLSGYDAYYIDKHLYLINPDIPEKTIEELVVKYETDDNFNPENIVIFGYSFSWVEMEHLKINLKRLKNTEKKLNINFDIRY